VELAGMIRDCAPQDLGCSPFTTRYQATRSPDRDSSVRATDTLVRLFSNSNSVIGLTRGCGLFLIDLLPAPRRFLARRMMFGMRALP
jgi:2-octaprenyl-6-methoxyphenol hydroxylase